MNKILLKTLPALALGLGLLSMTTGTAQAAVVFVFEGTTPGPVAGQTNFLYDLNFVNSLDFVSGQPNDRFVGDGSTYGTIYDIYGFVSASLTAGSPFTFTVQTPGRTPVAIFPTDGPLPNITVTYNGPTRADAVSFPLLLTVDSTGSQLNNAGQYSGQDQKNLGPSAGTPASNFGFVTVPAANTPEPASLFSMAGGAILLLAGRLRKKKA